MPYAVLTSRKTTPSRRCYDRGGLVGCYTTGWQDHIEIGQAFERRLRKDSAFALRVQRLFRRHARSLPRFLGQGYEHESRDNELCLETWCSSGAPNWDLSRRLVDLDEQCNLWTLLDFV